MFTILKAIIHFCSFFFIFSSLSLYSSIGHAEIYSVVVGIGEHAPSSFGVKNLASPPRDAAKFYEILQKTYRVPAQNIKMLHNKQATKKSIVAALRWLATTSQKDDQVVFYFSGYGTQVKDTSGDEPDGLDESLVPYDGGADPKTLIIDDEIHAWRKTINASQVTLILDACYRGDKTNSPIGATPKCVSFESQNSHVETKASEDNGFLREPDDSLSALVAQIHPSWLDQWGLSKGQAMKTFSSPTTIFTAAKNNQKAIDSGVSRRGSVFTHYFSEALRKFPYATPKQIIQYVHQNMRKDFKNKVTARNYLKTMTPQVEGYIERSVFIKDKQRAQQCLHDFCAEFWLVNCRDQPQYSFAPKEEVRFRFQFNKKAYAIVVNIDPQGRKTLLYPDMYNHFIQRSGKQDVYAYEAKTIHLLPPKGANSEAMIYVDGKPGEIETVILIATTDRKAIRSLRKIPLQKAELRGRLAQNIAQQTKEFQDTQAKSSMKKTRSFAKGSFEVKPPSRSQKRLPYLMILLQFKIAAPH